MEFFELYNGRRIPCIGYGTYPAKEKLVDSIPIAFENGYTLFDTSDNYLNEEYVGKGIASFEKEAIVISKFSSPDKTYQLDLCFENSRKKCKKINIYLLHWPYPFLWKSQWRELEKLYMSGRCDAIGVCNFDEKHLKRLIDFCKIKPMINQFERHPLFQQNTTYEFCKKHNIQVMCYSPLARMDQRLFGNPTLKRIAYKYNKSVGQIIIRWDIQTGGIPIPASTSAKHIRENINVFDFSLNTSEINEINDLEAGIRIRFDPYKRFSTMEKLTFFVKSLLK